MAAGRGTHQQVAQQPKQGRRISCQRMRPRPRCASAPRRMGRVAAESEGVADGGSTQVLIAGMLKSCRAGGINLQRFSHCGSRRLRLDFSAVSPVISHGFPPSLFCSLRSSLRGSHQLTCSQRSQVIMSTEHPDHARRISLLYGSRLCRARLPFAVPVFKGRTVPTCLKRLM